MKTVQISLNSIDKVKSFVNDITKFDYDFDLISGRYVIDAKSIMVIFSLDLSKPINLNIHADAGLDEILEILKPYIISKLSCRIQWPPSYASGLLFLQNICDSRRSYSIQIVSTVSIAVFISSSIFSFRCCSLLLMILIFGFVTGCFATKIVQQSS